MYKNNFSEQLSRLSERAVLKNDLKGAAEFLCENIYNLFPEGKITFNKYAGKRLAHITGAGIENYTIGVHIQLESSYVLIVKNISLDDSDFKKQLANIFEKIIHHYN